MIEVNVQLLKRNARKEIVGVINLEPHEFNKLRQEINAITEDVLEPPFIRVETKNEQEEI